MADGILTRMALLGFDDAYLAGTIKRSRQHVQSVRNGVYAEHLSAEQSAAILSVAKGYLKMVTDIVSEIELLS